MTAFYKLVKTSGAIRHNAEFRAITVENETVGMKRIQQRIGQSTTLTPADITAAITALKTEIADELKMGNKVHLPGIGFFSLGVKGELYEDPQSHNHRLRNARVRTVRFNPDTEFRLALADTKFTNRTDVLGKSSVPTADEVKLTLDSLFAKSPVITVNDLCRQMPLSRSYAYKLVKQLEENGKLRNIGTRYRKLYIKGKA
ncbi:MAG: HU family DNA-binding protein [Prevotella sp.]|nr:HU family DNA-binding protein [Prevotella sp.]